MFFNRGNLALKEGLSLSGIQQGLIAENIANISTPRYRRQDIDFKRTLSGLIGEQLNMKKTHMNHLPFNFQSDQMQAIIRKDNGTPVNSLGNNVDLDKEMVNMATNNTYYNALASFLGKKYNAWNSVISERAL